MKKIFTVALIFTFAAGGAVFATIASRDVKRMKEIDASIEENRAMRKQLLAEKKKLRQDVDEIKKQMAELPDSLGAARGGIAMKEARNIAKIEANLDNKVTMAKRVIRRLETEREAVSGHLKQWALWLGVFELVLLIALVIVLRNVP